MWPDNNNNSNNITTFGFHMTGLLSTVTVGGPGPAKENLLDSWNSFDRLECHCSCPANRGTTLKRNNNDDKDNDSRHRHS